jgi:pyridoxine/pyridoxamine 5'-phosphate oxidase
MRDGFVFYTNYDSAKGRELAENPRASPAAVLGRARAAGTHHGIGDQDDHRGIRRVFHSRPIEKPDRRGDLRPEPAD